MEYRDTVEIKLPVSVIGFLTFASTAQGAMGCVGDPGRQLTNEKMLSQSANKNLLLRWRANNLAATNTAARKAQTEQHAMTLALRSSEA
jgi:hypothetical protein